MQHFLEVEKTKAHLFLPIHANSWLSCFLLPALHHLLVKCSQHDANHYALPSVPTSTVSAGIRHHPSFLIPTPSYFHLHHTYLGYFSPLCFPSEIGTAETTKKENKQYSFPSCLVWVIYLGQPLQNCTLLLLIQTPLVLKDKCTQGCSSKENM